MVRVRDNYWTTIGFNSDPYTSMEVSFFVANLCVCFYKVLRFWDQNFLVLRSKLHEIS